MAVAALQLATLLRAQESSSLSAVEEISSADTYSKYPSIAFDAAGRLWIAWTSTRDGRDSIQTRRRTGSYWAPAQRLDKGEGLEGGVVLQRQGDPLWAVWQGQRSEGWSLFARLISGAEDHDGFGDEVRLTSESVKALHPLASGSADGLWVACEVALQGRFGVEALLLTDTPSSATPRPDGPISCFSSPATICNWISPWSATMPATKPGPRPSGSAE